MEQLAQDLCTFLTVHFFDNNVYNQRIKLDRGGFKERLLGLKSPSLFRLYLFTIQKIIAFNHFNILLYIRYGQAWVNSKAEPNFVSTECSVRAVR